MGVADLRYERLNMQVRETSIHKTWGFSSYFFHTLIKQRQLSYLRCGQHTQPDRCSAIALTTNSPYAIPYTPE